MSLPQTVLRTIREGSLLSPGDRVGVALSGGADSVALLRILEILRPSLGVTLVVAHFDHCLRGPDSDADSAFAAELARSLGLKFVLDREDVAAVATRNKWNLEDAARRLRYAFFQRLVDQGQATRIAVAHTADDQAETVLARLFRGTGPAGLAEIYPVAGAVVRPFLGVRRQDLREFLEGLGQPWREDASNLDMSRQRARIRQQLLPVLERDFSARIVDRLSEAARLSREQEEFWCALVEERFRALVRATPDSLSIDVAELFSPLVLNSGVLKPEGQASAESSRGMGGPAAPRRVLTERLIRRLYQGVRGELRDLGAIHVEQVIHLARECTSGHRVELPGGICVERSFNRLVFPIRAPRSKPLAYQYAIELPEFGVATVPVPELGACFSLKVVDWPTEQRDTKSVHFPLDAALLGGDLLLRNWKPGDAYRPRGHQKTRKLKEMFLAARIPSRERRTWPLLVSEGRVIWARGLPPAEEFCAGAQTRFGVVIEESRL
jgi:tRNA(Ile)-lysidine synthase